jgi:hypothetical protein
MRGWCGRKCYDVEMSAKVTSLTDVRRQREAQAGTEWELSAGAVGVESRADFHGGVLADGSIVTDVPSVGGRVQCMVSPSQAREHASLLLNLAWKAEQRQRKARGADLWIPRPGDMAGTYWVKQDKTERLFRRTTIRREARCCGCRDVIAAGSTAYCEAKPEPWTEPNWRDVRLCAACVERPVRTGVEEVRGG